MYNSNFNVESKIRKKKIINNKFLKKNIYNKVYCLSISQIFLKINVL